MAETIEKRVSEVEEDLAHLPEDLDARFAGVDTKLAQIREVQALHTTRFTTLEQKLNQLRQPRLRGLPRRGYALVRCEAAVFKPEA